MYLIDRKNLKIEASPPSFSKKKNASRAAASHDVLHEGILTLTKDITASMILYKEDQTKYDIAKKSPLPPILYHRAIESIDCSSLFEMPYCFLPPACEYSMSAASKAYQQLVKRVNS